MEKKVTKDFRDVKKEYGLILKWLHGGHYEGDTWKTKIWLENTYDPKKESKYIITESDGSIINQEAYNFIILLLKVYTIFYTLPFYYTKKRETMLTASLF